MSTCHRCGQEITISDGESFTCLDGVYTCTECKDCEPEHRWKTADGLSPPPEDTDPRERLERARADLAEAFRVITAQLLTTKREFEELAKSLRKFERDTTLQ